MFKKTRQKLNNKEDEKVACLCSTRPRGTKDSCLHSQSPKEIREVHKISLSSCSKPTNKASSALPGQKALEGTHFCWVLCSMLWNATPGLSPYSRELSVSRIPLGLSCSQGFLLLNARLWDKKDLLGEDPADTPPKSNPPDITNCVGQG